MIHQEPVSLGSQSPSEDVPSEVFGSASPPAITGSQKGTSNYLGPSMESQLLLCFPPVASPCWLLPPHSLLSKSPLFCLTLGLPCFGYLDFHLHVPEESAEPL